ncbi:glycosyltransferase family 8 protein [Campylobacter taeniopygiae]|uniref:Glycosyltransferase family 8 protein n=1 Tax=Campylobacter taeniopygiae TaxID=2510188 RepID=A0ABY2TJV7_9BACT|nr:glycosyltransferase family 8 protein [Campylobacter taeniopygiae]TKX34236.1 glycosyltransferase family 8 protein [Campylobacter taeniopygiae]
MYHLVFSADENYIKYTSVLITSIILNTDKNKKIQDFDKNSNIKNEKYFFHILSNFVSDKTREKLLNLQNALNEIFPCKIIIHIKNDEDFENFPTSGAAHSLKLPYYRLRLSSIFDESIKKCLYLDSDMLCMCDIRELFSINLKDKIVGVVGDPGSKKSKIKFKENDKKKIFYFDENYFNSGLLLINLEEYKKHSIEQKCEELASKCYYIKAADQDLLNATIHYKHQLKLDFAYNFSTIAFCYVICKDENKNRLNYTRNEFNKSIKNPKILHYGEKPWRFLKSYFDYKGTNINEYWWDMAIKTPIFNEELLKSKKNITNHLLCAGLGRELFNAALKFNFPKIKFLIKNTSNDEKYMQRAESIEDDFFGICCILGIAISYARSHKKNLFSVYLKALKMIYNFKKYHFRSRI